MPISIKVLCDAEGSISNLGTTSNEKRKKNVLHLLMFKTDTSDNSLDNLFQKFNKDKKLEICSQNHYFFKIINVKKLLNYR